MNKSVIAVVLAVLVGLFILFYNASARASECYSVKNYSDRMQCLAVERGEPAGCLGVRDPDQRVICRQKATRFKSFRHMEKGFDNDQR